MNTEDLNKKTLKQYCFFEEESDGNGYFMHFESLSDAAHEAAGREIYLARYKKLGVFKSKVVLQKVKKRKKSRGVRK